MLLIDLLKELVVQPLTLIYGAAFTWILSWAPGPGWALIAFGILLNLGLLPIYYQMEAAGQESARNLDAMNAEIARMKAHYRGRERFYYVRTVHRVFGYRPISAIYRSGDLFLQVLVFATVYRFLSAHQGLAGERFWVIPDLGRPDGLLWGANLLPVVMTAFNVASALLYGRDSTARRNAFLLAGVFLVLLYASPSGLVLYWTTNNVFSLVRNLVQRKLAPLLPAGIVATLSRVRAQV